MHVRRQRLWQARDHEVVWNIQNVVCRDLRTPLQSKRAPKITALSPVHRTCPAAAVGPVRCVSASHMSAARVQAPRPPLARADARTNETHLRAGAARGRVPRPYPRRSGSCLSSNLTSSSPAIIPCSIFKWPSPQPRHQRPRHRGGPPNKSKRKTDKVKKDALGLHLGIQK